jgi:hypothetical protein
MENKAKSPSRGDAVSMATISLLSRYKKGRQSKVVFPLHVKPLFF